MNTPHVHRLFVGFVAALMLLSSFQLSAQDDNTLLFTSDRDGNREIYSMDVDGSNLRRLTTDSGEDVEPAWSPDHRQIAFASNRDGNFAIYLMNADGSGVRRMTGENLGSYNSSPSWSPDGQQFAFVSNAPGKNQIYVAGLDGNQPKRVTRTTTDTIDPAWSPDGQWIAFAATIDDIGNFEINLMRPDGSDQHQLTKDENVDSDSPAWSHDGTLLAFAANGESGEIDVMNADGSKARLVAAATDGYAGSPAWSPDNQQIAYSVEPNEGDDLVYIVHVDGMSARPLPNLDGKTMYPSWASPRQIAAVAPGPSSNPAATTYSDYLPGVITTARLNVRKGPSPDHYEVGRISLGDNVHVLARNDDASWVEIDAGVVGWINASYVGIQGSSSDLPVRSANSPMPEPQLPLSYACPGSRGPSFRVNQRFVIPHGDGPSGVFADAGREPRLGLVDEGGGGIILGGPICARAPHDFLTWWYVRTSNGLEGYMSEGFIDTPVPWIAPAGS